MRTVRWGIISTGRIADWFVRDFCFVPDAELVAVASRTLASAQQFATTHGIPRAYEGYQALLDDSAVDAVYIGTPHTLHLANATDALSAGKAVLCEKPLTVSPAECQVLIDKAESENCFLMEAMWTFFLPAILRAQEWVRQGRIGQLRQIKADFGYPQAYDPNRREYNAQLGGGALLEMGIYPVALAWLFMARDPIGVQAVARHAPNHVEHEVEMLFDYGEATATLGTSFQCKLPNVAYVIGTEGYIAIPDFWRARTCKLYELDICTDQFDDNRLSQGFNYEAAAVTRDVLAGKIQSDVVPWAYSLKFQEHLARVRACCAQSLLSRKPVAAS